jgi:hypothetical protein
VTATRTRVGEYVAVIGETRHECDTLAQAKGYLNRELAHWIRHARFFENSALDGLTKVEEGIRGATKSKSWHFTIDGHTGVLALIVPK